MRAPWLGDVLADAGLTVIKIGNPHGRGREMSAIYGVVGHDTVTTSSWTNPRVDALLRDGRPGVPGPLAQLGLDRQCRYRWIADGRCNHNGYGTWKNDAIGIEVYAAGGLAGHLEPWSPGQREAFEIGTAAILRHLGHDSPSSYWNPRAAGHKETDAARKIDPYRISMPAVRTAIAVRLAGRPTPPVAPPSRPQEDIVASIADLETVIDRKLGPVLATVRGLAAAAVATERAAAGLKPSPASDAIWADRIGQGQTLADARAALVARADETGNLTERIALVRKAVGLPPDPASDEAQARHIANGRTWDEVELTLAAKAADIAAAAGDLDEPSED